jgi:DNA primase
VTQFKINCKDEVWLWHCFGDCQRGGDVIELVKAVTGYDNTHVRFWFAEKFGDRLTLGKPIGKKSDDARADKAAPDDTKDPTQAASTARSELANALPDLKPLRFRLDLDPDVPYLRQRRLTPETIARYGLGLCRRGLLKGYVAIPIFGYPHPDGANPLAYLGRWPGEDYDETAGRPRYKWPEAFPKSSVVYGLAEAMDGTSGKPLIVVEGPFAVFELSQVGYRNAVAVCGSTMSREQAQILAGTSRHIVLAFDDDDAGHSGMNAAVVLLTPHAFTRVLPLATNDRALQLLSKLH